jgi:hypothetical protein
MIRDKYIPIAYAIRHHWPGTTVDILPMNTSRKGAPYTFTIANLTSLLTLRTDPPNNLRTKGRLDTARILTQLH